MTGLAKTKTISLNMLVYLFVAVFSAQIAGIPVCRASDKAGGNFIFILDASGSMAGKIQGKPKIDVAKEVLSNLIKELPETTNVGLVAYGHRQKGDCNDVEELAPIAPVNKTSLINQISGLHPKGMTPLTYSIQKVAEGLKGKAADTTIILVSDGEETCKGDPCAVVRELKAAGATFVLHVIGFDVGEKEKKQLNCIAKAGNGFYFTARNAGELKLAAKQAVEKKEPPKSTLTIKALRNGQPLQARYELFKTDEETAKQGEKIGTGVTEKGGATLILPPGTYNLVVENTEDTLKPTVTFEGVTIGLGENVEKIAEFSGGTLMVKALRNGVSVNASCSIYKAGGDQEKGKERITGGATDGKGKEFKLAPGGYEITVEDLEDANRPSMSFQNVMIEAGKTVEKVAEFSGGALIVKALKNGKPFQAAFSIVYKTNEDEDKEKEKAAEARIELDGTQFKFTPGAYDVVVVNQEDATKPTVSFQGVSIEAGKTVEKTADFSGGGLKISALRNSKPFSAELVVYKATQDKDQKKERVVGDWTGVEGKTVKLPPGVYDLMVKNHDDAGKPELSFPGIMIEIGKTVEKTADFSGGVLKVSALRNGKPFSAEAVVLKTSPNGDQKKERVVANWTGTEGIQFKLPPGVYDLMVKNHEDAGKPELSFPAITVEAGKTVEKTADFTGGGLKVSALRNGKPFSAEAVVLKAAQGDQKKERVVANWTGTAGIQFKLPPGVYDLMVKNHDDAGKPELAFPGIMVEAGKIAEKTVEFSGGGLKVMALRNGKPFSAEAVVLKAAQGDQKKERIIANWTGNEGIQFKLSPGVYDLMVKNHDDAGKPESAFPDITVEAGKTVEKTAEFSGGGLKVSALRNGKPFSAEMVVLKAAQDGDQKKERLLSDWTGTAGKTVKLPPGVYDLTVRSHEDTGKPEQSFPGITVEAGKIVEKTVEFPGGAPK